MKRRLLYLSVALATLLAGVALHLALRSSRMEFVGARWKPPVTHVPREARGAALCQPDTTYLWEKAAYDEGGVVNPVCATLQSRLLNAAGRNDVDAARAALEAGAHPEAWGYPERHSYPEAKYPLIWAAGAGSDEVVGLLLDNGADIEHEACCCMSCDTPLFAAIESGDAATVELLLSRGADVNHVDRQFAPEQTALWRAEQKGNREIIDLVRRAAK